MNRDLSFRLTDFGWLEPDEGVLLGELLKGLTGVTMDRLNRLHPNDKPAIAIHFEEIDSEEDDTAYVTSFDGIRFDVYLDKRMPIGSVLDYLIHELSHVISWHHDEKDDHGILFGVAYARIYRHYLKLYDKHCPWS
jgi:hypothetical protein